MPWNFHNTYVRLPSALHSAVSLSPVANPRLGLLNPELATQLGLAVEELESGDGPLWLSGSAAPSGSEPLAQAYAGHQFGHFTMLGDGRALLLGEHIDPQGRRWDIHLKGSGPTPYSRRGDGRAAIGPMLRECLVSEFLHAMGIPTTRGLAVVWTGEPVFREAVLKGAVLTRVAQSHIRVGTFEYVAALQDAELLRVFANYVIDRHDPEVKGAANPYLEFLRRVVTRQAELVARWMEVGFIHGVMNTDNMAISGETIDFGPCAFLDEYDAMKVLSSIDRHGRYAYGQQPPIARWNLARLAETLLPLIDPEPKVAVELVTAAISDFGGQFEGAWLRRMRLKLGLMQEQDHDLSLIERLLDWMQKTQSDYTNTFRYLCRLDGEVWPGIRPNEEFESWIQDWQQRVAKEGVSLTEAQARMRLINPAIIPRNHRVEFALKQAQDHEDLTDVIGLMARLKRPLAYQPEGSAPDLRAPPKAGERVQATFCGT